MTPAEVIAIRDQLATGIYEASGQRTEKQFMHALSVADHTGATHYTCDTCKESHHFQNEYFAKQWANRHGQMFTHTICTCC